MRKAELSLNYTTVYMNGHRRNVSDPCIPERDIIKAEVEHGYSVDSHKLLTWLLTVNLLYAFPDSVK